MKQFIKISRHVTGGKTTPGVEGGVWGGGEGNLDEQEEAQPGSWRAVPRLHSNSEHVKEQRTALDLLKKSTNEK